MILRALTLGFLCCVCIADVYAKMVRVMTCNVRRKGTEKKEEYRWENRKEALIELFVQKELDIIGLQEPVEEQVDDIAEKLDQYAWVGDPRGTVWIVDSNEFNPIFYNKERFSKEDAGTFYVTKPWWNFLWATVSYLPRICTWVLLQDLEQKKCFYVYNTHLDNASDKARKQGLIAIFEAIAKQAKKHPIILLGDLNMEITEEFAKLLAEHNLKNAQDVAKEKGPSKGTHKLWDENSAQAQEQIDYIFVSDDNFVVEKYEIITTEKVLSDHRPIMADLELK